MTCQVEAGGLRFGIISLIGCNRCNGTLAAAVGVPRGPSGDCIRALQEAAVPRKRSAHQCKPAAENRLSVGCLVVEICVLLVRACKCCGLHVRFTGISVLNVCVRMSLC